VGRRPKSAEELLKSSPRAAPGASARARADLSQYLRVRDTKLARQRAWYLVTRESSIARVKRNNARAWEDVSAIIGSACVVCGESDPVVLHVDHKVPVRRKGRYATTASVPGLLARLRDGREHPANLQVLCANCHARKTGAERRPVPAPARSQRLHSARRYDRVKLRLQQLFGGVCALCSESDPRVLVLDHKASRGNRRERTRPTGPRSILAALRNGKENPFNLQLLCANCHARKTASEFARRVNLPRAAAGSGQVSSVAR
jgi:5-methylcytosine-specific restriction endonuclease McrA